MNSDLSEVLKLQLANTGIGLSIKVVEAPNGSIGEIFEFLIRNCLSQKDEKTADGSIVIVKWTQETIEKSKKLSTKGECAIETKLSYGILIDNIFCIFSEETCTCCKISRPIIKYYSLVPMNTKGRVGWIEELQIGRFS